MNHILSCYDRKSTLVSISKITDIFELKIEQFVSSLPCELPNTNPAHYLWNEFQNNFVFQLRPFGTSFFHGCRRFEKPLISMDLLPSPSVTDLIWENIWESCADLLPMDSLHDFKRSFFLSPFCREYSKRVKGSRIRERGPWAFIVRDCLRCRGTSHYTHRLPEILSLIANFVAEEFSIDISGRLNKRTKPYIIQFRTSESDPIDLGYALLHLHEHYKDTPFSYDYKCFSAEGRAVPATNILRIEEVQE